MQIYYPNMLELHQATLELDHVACQHCGACQLLSHGFVYKKQYLGNPVQVGKRLFCSNRYGRYGCGRTLRLYTADRVPGLHYACAFVIAFMLGLLQGLSIAKAYHSSTRQLDARNAYRWLKRFQQRLPAWRTLLPLRNASCLLDHRCRTLRLLLPTCQQLIQRFSPKPGQCYQFKLQSPFI